MAKAKQVINSLIKLKNTKNGVVTTITLEQSSETRDFKIKIPTTSGKFVSEERVDSSLRRVTDFLRNPTVETAVKTPTIVKATIVDGDVYLELSKFISQALLMYAATRVQISNTQEFRDGETLDLYFHNLRNIETTIIEGRYFTIGNTYYIRALYGASGIESMWSNIYTLKYTAPSIPTPTISDVYCTYSNVYPFPTTINVESSPYTPEEGITLQSIVFKFYKELPDGTFDLKFTKEENINPVENNEDIVHGHVFGMFPNILNHDEDYYVSVIYRDSSHGYSLESNKFKFRSTGVRLLPVNFLESYPSIINISNPRFSFHNDLYYSVNGVESKIDNTEITNVNWRIHNTTKSTPDLIYNTKGFDLDLKEGSLSPNCVYEVSVFYTHATLGISSVKTKTFKTRSFISFLDGLNKPKKTYNSTAYYGEISYDKLLPENIVFTGDYTPGRFYKLGEEVSKTNESTGESELFICINPNDQQNINFDNHFESAATYLGRDLYKSGIPSVKRVLDYIGIKDTEKIINLQTGWVKVQNNRGKMLYMSKLPVLNNVSLNFLLERGFWHPRRLTMRIYDKVYYVRTVIDNCDVGYDSLDPKLPNQNFYKEEVNGREVEYNERLILEWMMNGRLNDYNTTSLGFTDSSVKEFIYTKGIPQVAAPVASSGIIEMERGDISGVTDESYALRLVLELIPDEELPIYNMSKRIPGPRYTNEELKKIYRKYSEVAYLGYVPVDEFVTSETIDFKTGLLSGKHNPILGWHKFYYRGLIYFFADGYTFTRMKIKDIVKNNLYREFNKFAMPQEQVKLGKVIFNNLAFNVSCPKVLTAYKQPEVVDGLNIFGDHSTVTMEIALDCFFSDAICNIFRRDVLLHKDPMGHKGRIINLERLTDISVSKDENDKPIIGITHVGTSLPDDFQVATFLSSNTTESDNKFVTNYCWKPMNINVVDNPEGRADIISVLTICPTIDCGAIWN